MCDSPSYMISYYIGITTHIKTTMADPYLIFDYLRENKNDIATAYILNNKKLDYNIKNNAGTYLIFNIVLTNNLELLKSILATSIKIDVCDTDGRTIMYNPIKFGYNEIVAELINHSRRTIGVPICNLFDSNGNTALHYAITFKNIDCVDILLPYSNNTSQNKSGNTALHIAVMSRSCDVVEKIYNQIGDKILNIQNNSGETALHIACKLSLFDISRFLLTHGADANIAEYQLRSYPLHYACYSGNNSIVTLLLEHEPDVNVQDINGNTPMHYCVMYEKLDALRTLTTNSKIKANANMYNTNLALPLHIIFNKSVSNLVAFVDILIPITNLNFQNTHGITCMHHICRTSFWKQYEHTLERKKMDILIESNDGIRPVDYVDKNDLELFVEIVANSYVHFLFNKHAVWNMPWENKCSESGHICKKEAISKINKLIKSQTRTCRDRTYPTSVNTIKCVEITFDERTRMNTMIGTSLDIVSGLLYLSYKHTTLGIVYGQINETNMSKWKFYKKNNISGMQPFDCILETYFLTWYDGKLDVDDSVTSITRNLLRDTTIEYIVYFVRIVKYDGNGHANVLMYSKHTNELERFDPLGAEYEPSLDDNLVSYFEKIIPSVKYISPNQYMSSVGFQKIDLAENQNEYIGDPNGFCVSWSMWYVDTRISFPEIPRTKFIKHFIQQITEKHTKYRSFVRNYSANITKIRDDILLKSSIDINQFINGEYNDDTLNILLNNINTTLQKIL